MFETVAASSIIASLGVAAGMMSLVRDSPSPESYVTFYRAMSSQEYNNTKGYLQDLNVSGEGPHVRADLSYLLHANFINKKDSGYDYIVRYNVSKEAATSFFSTPFIFTRDIGKGGPIFNAARAAGMPYMKYEKGFSLGFPGRSTQTFNSSLINAPSIIMNIKK